MSYQDSVDYARLSERLTKSLRLESGPVAVNFSARIPDGVDKLDEISMTCMMLDIARFQGKVFYTEADNHQKCPNGAYYMGLQEPFPGLTNGEANAGEGGSCLVANPAAFLRLLPHYEIIPQQTISYISYAPLSKMPFGDKTGGTVVVFFLTPQQSMFLQRGVNYKTGVPVDSLTGPSTCSTVMAAPFLNGKPYASQSCFGFHLFTQVKPEQMVMGIPLEMLPEIADNIDEFQLQRPDLAEMLDRR